MGVLAQIIHIIPEKSEIEIPIKISGLKIVDISSTNSSVTITSSAEVIEMDFTETEYKTITIPDFNEPLRGTFTLDEDTSVVELRDIPIDEARVLILDYIKENHGADTHDIIFELALDVKLVLGILKELYEKEEIVEVES